jgi:hypothetical protein
MEAIQGATLRDLLPLVRNNGTWGTVFTCHLFNEFQAALSGLLDMSLMYMNLNLDNTIFRYKVDPGTNEFPRLMLVDLDLCPEENDSAKTGLTTNAILGLCSEVCKAEGSQAYPISMAAQLPDQPAKPRKFAKIKAYSSVGSDDKSSAGKKVLIDVYDIETMKDFDEYLSAPLDCKLDLATLGWKFKDATEGVVGNSLNVPDWPTRALEQLVRKLLLSNAEIAEAHAKSGMK